MLQRWQWVFLAAGFCVFVALRYLAALDDFCLDEIWSLDIVTNASSRMALLTQIRHDNNHILNSLILSFVSAPKHWIYYRLHSLVFGSLTLIALVFARVRRGFQHATLILLLAGSSFYLTVYASEARGYAAAAFFGVVAYLLVGAFDAGRVTRKLIIPAHWITVILGFLAHYSFVFVYGALFVWSFWLCRQKDDSAKETESWLALQSVPIPLLGALYLEVFRNLLLAGGENSNLVGGIQDALAYTIGLPAIGLAAKGAFLVYGTLLVYCVFRALRHKDKDAVFFLLALCIVPAVIIGTAHVKFFFHRFVFVLVPFVYLACSDLLMAAFSSYRWRRWLAALVLLVFISGNARYNYMLIIREGRASYREAVCAMLNASGQKPIRIGTDWASIQSWLILHYYMQQLQASSKMQLIEGPYNDRPLDWYVINYEGDDYKPEATVTLGKQHLVHFGSFRRAIAISGWNWELYKAESDKNQTNF